MKKRRAKAMRFWRVMNPLARPFAGWVPWWVVLETRGRKSGQARTVPLARGPREGHVLWLIAVHGRHAAFARNLVAHPRVRVKMRGRWHPGTASLAPLDDGILRRFNFYARGGPRIFGIDAALVRIELDPDS